MVSPPSGGLFHGAIMQSGAFDNYTVQEEPDANFDAFATRAGPAPTLCFRRVANGAALACLRRLQSYMCVYMQLYMCVYMYMHLGPGAGCNGTTAAAVLGCLRSRSTADLWSALASTRRAPSTMHTHSSPGADVAPVLAGRCARACRAVTTGCGARP
jgi:hypothetical protein